MNFVIANMIIKRGENGRYTAMPNNEQENDEDEREEVDPSHRPNQIRA